VLQPAAAASRYMATQTYAEERMMKVTIADAPNICT